MQCCHSGLGPKKYKKKYKLASWFYASSHNHLSFTPTCHPHSSLTTSTAILAATHHYSFSPFNPNIGKSISDMSMEQIPNGLDLNSETESAMAIANAKLALLSTDPTQIVIFQLSSENSTNGSKLSSPKQRLYPLLRIQM